MALKKRIDVSRALEEFITMEDGKGIDEETLRRYYARWETREGEDYVVALQKVINNPACIKNFRENRRGYGGGSGHEFLPAR